MVVYYGTSVDGTVTSTNSTGKIPLDGPQMFMGEGQVALLGTTCNDLTFVNEGATADASIRIFVGRTAIDDNR